YAVYCQAYADFDWILRGERHATGGGPYRVVEAVVEFAIQDAANGTPRRSREQFERCLRHGSEALGPLGFRRDAA
ncbi:MAG TPA: hypothetical protein VFP50_01075, partial [Anaeromyxobacteraceae bacterium]|nr:hypothetical protein [Anaeromyxobacteraceae bacterium]